MTTLAPYVAFCDKRDFAKFLEQCLDRLLEKKVAVKDAASELAVFFDKVGADIIHSYERRKTNATNFIYCCVQLAADLKQ